MSILDLPKEKRTCLITGCSSGIGYHAALELKKRGIRVFATARKAEDVERLRNEGLEAFQLDMDNSESIQSVVEQTLAQTNNQLYAIFNNAGFGQPGAVEDLSRDMIRQQFETNVFGIMELSNKILPIMRQQGYGRIIQNSSVLGIISLPFRGAYNASKHALEAMTDTMRLELHYEPIEVIAIEPGPIVSKFRDNALQKFKDNIDTEHSVHRELYEVMGMRLENKTKEAPFTLGPEAVTEKVWHALTAKKPKAKYAVTKPTHMLAFAKRILPTCWLDKILLKAAGEEAEMLKHKNH
tara:strand:+ start:66194 stop:67081 length:888 start_codon:yes stop_codon:yes gene_type:complete